MEYSVEIIALPDSFLGCLSDTILFSESTSESHLCCCFDCKRSVRPGWKEQSTFRSHTKELESWFEVHKMRLNLLEWSSRNK